MVQETNHQDNGYAINAIIEPAAKKLGIPIK
jgi:hypothetical protein